MSESNVEANNRPDELIVPVKEFRSSKGNTVTELVLCEPSMRTIKEATKQLKFNGANPTPDSAHDYFIKLVALHCNLSEREVENLPVSKVNQAGQYLASFTMEGVTLQE